MWHLVMSDLETRTSLGFSTIEKHWKIRSGHRFDGVYATKLQKLCAWGTRNTDSISRLPERIGNRIYLIKFPNPKLKQSKRLKTIFLHMYCTLKFIHLNGGRQCTFNQFNMERQ